MTGPALRAAALAAVVLTGAAPAAAASLASCAAGLKARAIAAGIKPGLAGQALDGVRFDEKAVRFSRSQPEFRTPIWDYMAFLVDPERIADGKTMLDRHGRTLAAVERAYAVDRIVIAALWGIESDYGRIKGEFFMPHALANVICAGRKPQMFTGELIAGLRLVQRGDVKLADLRSSWASAFGQTQFIPTTYQRLAVDFDGDGRRDLVNSVPDALASSANFLRKAGWSDAMPWGFEVTVPKGYSGPTGRKAKAALSAWAQRGIKRADGRPLKGGYSAGLIRPAGAAGPAFLVTRNFDALYSYNAAESYALAIGHLADRLRGGGPLAAKWPTDDPGLTRRERLELQRLLLAAGYAIGEADGKIGPVTVAAIKEAQAKAGLKPDGRPGRAIYRALGGR